MVGNFPGALPHRQPDALWTFATVDGIEPTNNPDERALRAPVIHRKISLRSHGHNRERFAERALSAAKAERYPIAATNGNYSAVGSTFGQSRGVFSFQAGVSIPIFTGGRIAGDIVQAEVAFRQRSAEAENIRGQIDYDVRTAFFNLNAAVEQVAVTRQNVDLANETLSRSIDRFAAGVTDSVEVVQSEQSLASANDQYITALYNHNVAKLSLARALGVARTNYSQYLGGK
jgi:outer membrane protein TolC